MAKTKDSGTDPTEPPVWLPDGTGEQWRKKRDELDITQRELARRVGVTSGTISNVETGKQRSLDRKTYARWRRILFKELPDVPDDVFERLLGVFADVDREEAEKLIAVAAVIKKPRKKE